MGTGKATRTIVQRLETRKLDWVASTIGLYNEVAHFYFLVITNYPSLQGLGVKNATSKLEKLTVVSKARPAVEIPLPWDKLPRDFRRAAIASAVGSASSFFTNLNKWSNRKQARQAKGKKFTERPPVPPRTWNIKPTFYAQMYLRDSFAVMLKLFTGESWSWVKFKTVGREIPQGWEFRCPHLVQKGGRLELHFPIEKVFEKPQKVKEQVKDEDVKICSVDLNISDRLAVCTILKRDGTQVATKFIRGGDYLNARRKCCLGRVARNRRLTGICKSGETDNKGLWEKVRHIDDYEAHRISRRIVDFARENGASIIVFEHLANFKPKKGKYSRRGNEKRAYWLRGKIYKFTKYKAWEYGIIISRVNPRNTSRDCSYCDVSPIFRHGEHEQPTEYRPGAPLFTCANGHRGNADLNASRNIGFKLFARHGYQKPVASESLRRGCSNSPCNLPNNEMDVVTSGVVRESERGTGAPHVYPSLVGCEPIITEPEVIQPSLFDLQEVESTTQMLRTPRRQGCRKKQETTSDSIQLSLF